MTGTPQTSRPSGDLESRSGETTTSPLPDGPIRPVAGVNGDEPQRLEPRRWRVEFPPGMELLTSNGREHWAVRARITKQISDTAIVLCRAAKIPRLHRVAIVAEFQPPTGRRRVVREAHNLGPAVKAGIDGCVRAGVLADDSDRYVAEVAFRSGETYPLGRLVLTIYEVETPHE